MGQAQVFVHIEGHHVGEGQLAGLVLAGQLFVHADRAGAGGQTEHEGTVLLGALVVSLDLGGDIIGRPFAHFIVIVLNHYTHNSILTFCG